MARIIFVSFLIFVSACSTLNDGHTPKKFPKNIILLIPDGFGMQEYALMKLYARQSKNYTTLNFDTLLNTGESAIITTWPYGALVADSAASGTQMATGEPSRAEMIGVNKDGKKVLTILELAKKQGKAVGLITDTRVTHATPATFATHTLSRADENIIAKKIIHANPDILLGGGLRHFLPKNLKNINKGLFKKIPSALKAISKRKDNQNIITLALKKKYDAVFTKDQLLNSDSKKILGLFANSEMPDAIEVSKKLNDPKRSFPTVLEMADKSLEVLTKNPNGFFLMVETGMIDWASHQNDAGRLLHELLNFDRSLGHLKEFTLKRDDTLLIVVADHETGGFGFSYSKYNIPKPIYLKSDEGKKLIYRPLFNYGNNHLLKKIYNQKLSFKSMLRIFDRLPKKKQTPAALQNIVNQSSEFKIKLADAQNILKREPNEYYKKNHETLFLKSFPKIDDFKEFYVSPAETRRALIGRALSKQQNVVWATGSHTSSPVLALACGLGSDKIKGIMHMTELGKLMHQMFLSK